MIRYEKKNQNCNQEKTFYCLLTTDFLKEEWACLGLINSGWHCNGIRLVDVAGNSRSNNTFFKKNRKKILCEYTFKN